MPIGCALIIYVQISSSIAAQREFRVRESGLSSIMTVLYVVLLGFIGSRPIFAWKPV